MEASFLDLPLPLPIIGASEAARRKDKIPERHAMQPAPSCVSRDPPLKKKNYEQMCVSRERGPSLLSLGLRWSGQSRFACQLPRALPPLSLRTAMNLTLPSTMFCSLLSMFTARQKIKKEKGEQRVEEMSTMKGQAQELFERLQAAEEACPTHKPYPNPVDGKSGRYVATGGSKK